MSGVHCSRVTVADDNELIQKTRRKDIKCFHRKEMFEETAMSTLSQTIQNLYN